MSYNQTIITLRENIKKPKRKIKVTRKNIDEDALDKVDFELMNMRVRVK